MAGSQTLLKGERNATVPPFGEVDATDEGAATFLEGGEESHSET